MVCLHFWGCFPFNSRLGATPIMELMIASGKAVPKLQLEHGLAVDRVYTGSFMTSLDMAGLLSLAIAFYLINWYCIFPDFFFLPFSFFSVGFSISIMKADETILQRLDAATKAPYWPVGVDGLWMCLNITYFLNFPKFISSMYRIVFHEAYTVALASWSCYW